EQTEWITRETDFRLYITSQVRKYGKIKHLILTQHGGVEGIIGVAPGVTFSHDTLEKYDKAVREFGPNSLSAKNHGKPLEFIQFLRGNLAPGAKVTFVQCQKAGPKYNKVSVDLQKIFGPDINVVLFDGDCGFRNGVPMKQTTRLRMIFNGIGDWWS